MEGSNNGIQEEFGNKKTLSRRDFLKLTASGVLGLVLSDLGIESVEAKKMEPKYIEGIEVYGLDKLNLPKEKIEEMLDGFDQDFERKLSWFDKGKNIWEQREIVLPKNERFIQFVVKKSVYDSFERRKGETGVNYVQWVKLHVDLMNRILEASDPPVALKNKIKRIIVVDDDFENNPVRYTKDIDSMWFHDADDRASQSEGVIGQGSYWSSETDTEDNLVLRNPAGSSFGRQIIFDNKSDSFDSARDGVWLDCGLIHELGHLTWNIPDEYMFSYENSNSLFSNFRFNTGYFMEPSLSPYLSYLINRNVANGLRSYYMDQRGIGMAKGLVNKYDFLSLIPSEINLNIRNGSLKSISRSEYNWPDYYDDRNGGDSCKYMDKVVDCSGATSLILDQGVLAPTNTSGETMYPVLLRIDCVSGGVDKELYLPLAILNMSKMSGQDKLSYNIEFSNDSYPVEYKTQTVNLVDEDDVTSFEVNNLTYAKMRIEGTKFWCIWSFQY